MCGLPSARMVSCRWSSLTSTITFGGAAMACGRNTNKANSKMVKRSIARILGPIRSELNENEEEFTFRAASAKRKQECSFPYRHLVLAIRDIPQMRGRCRADSRFRRCGRFVSTSHAFHPVRQVQQFTIGLVVEILALASGAKDQFLRLHL